MADTQGLFIQGIETWTGLAKRWAGIPEPDLGTDIIPGQLQILTNYAGDSQQPYTKTYRQLMGSLPKSSNKLPKTIAALMRARNPEEVAKFPFASSDGWLNAFHTGPRPGATL